MQYSSRNVEKNIGFGSFAAKTNIFFFV